MATTFSKNLLYLRKKAGKSQAAIALQLSKGQTTIGNWENAYSEPSLAEIVEISNIFGINTSDLLTVDLNNVHLIENEKDKENADSVHLNVHGNVHPTGEKHPNSAYKSNVLEDEQGAYLPLPGKSRKFDKMPGIVELYERLVYLDQHITVLEDKILKQLQQLTQNGSK
jgi:transcriptional regulator with XRE-family HTH domain